METIEDVGVAFEFLCICAVIFGIPLAAIGYLVYILCSWLFG